MNWFKTILTYIAAANMVLLPTLAHAEQIGPHYFQQFDGYDKATLSYKLDVDYTKKMAFLRLEGQPPIRDANTPPPGPGPAYKKNQAIVLDPHSGHIALHVPFTPEGQLRRFEPKELNKYFVEQMQKVSKPVGAAFTHSVKALPTESAIFFMAMGAVVASQLMLDYSSNPLAMQKHIEHHLSPLGSFGFFTFMLSQGITSNMLSMYIKNPKLHFMIPYMGMAVGAFVQSYLTQFIGDPNVWACAKTWGGYQVTKKDIEAGVDADPCSKAHDYYVLQGKIWEFAPGMVSVVLSAALAAVGQKALMTTLKAVGINFAFFFVPGKMQLTGMRLFFVKGLQISVFGTLDMLINRWVTTHWKNIFDGSDLYKMNRSLVGTINKQKQSGWTINDKETDPNAELKKFTTKMAEWRMMNLSAVYESHQLWSENILRLMQLYNSSEKFYGTLVDEVRSETFRKNSLKALELSYPFNGVSAKGLDAERQDLYYTQPLAVQSMQIDTMNDAIKFIDEQVVALNLKNTILPHELKALAEVRSLLAQEEELQKVEGLNALNRALDYARKGTPTRLYLETLYKVREKLGNPNPLMEPGRGFLATYEQAPLNEPFVKGVPFYRSVGRYATPKLTDSLLMQMICGPDIDKKESSVKFTRGFYTVFAPPHIRSNNHDFTDECESYGAGTLRNGDSIYSTRIRQGGKEYKGFLSYIKDNIRPEILGEKYQPGFQDWWKKTTESQMIQAFADYESQYIDIIVKLLEGVKTTEMRSTNMGPIANGAMLSIIQQKRIYLGILDDLLSNSPNKLVLNFHEQGYFSEPKKQAPKSAMSKKVEQEFNNLYKLFNQIRVEKQNGKNIIASSVENAQLEEQLKAIQATLTEFSEMLGADKKGSPRPIVMVAPKETAPGKAVVKLSEPQIQLAVTALEGLQSIAAEILMYGSISNAVTWDKIRAVKKANPALDAVNKMVEEYQKQSKGLTPGSAK